MSDKRYWVGKRDGNITPWLSDELIQHEDPSMIYLFDIGKKVMTEHSKQFARQVLRPVNKEQAKEAVSEYIKWYGINGAAFIEHDKERRQRLMQYRNEEAEKKRNKAIQNHKDYLARHGKEYKGIRLTEFGGRRVTHCYACQKNLDSSIHIQCESCNWLICYCGACGCGYLGTV